MVTFMKDLLRPHSPVELSNSIFVLMLIPHFSPKSDGPYERSGNAVCCHISVFWLSIRMILL